MSKFYLTTTLPYINSVPHLGHAMEFVQGDSRVRFEKMRGNEVFFNIGTDEHGEKILGKAKEKKQGVKEYADQVSLKFRQLAEDLSVEPSRFIRTTDSDHRETVEKFWLKCLENGDIYKKKHRGLYCVGCELYVKERDLIEGNKCPFHPSTELEQIEEENYFFRFSKYQDALLKLYENKNFIIPTTRLNEIKAFVERGLEDFSISRDRNKLSWGIPVPNDETQVIYVWFDALVNYLTSINWPDGDWESWWGVSQIAGKDNLRQQAAIWQAMLLSVGLKPSKQIFIHGFITSKGQKMSKSVGNVMDPNLLISKYGSDATRYLLLRSFNSYEDTDVTYEILNKIYTSDLVNGIGNLFSRVMKMASDNFERIEFDRSIDFSYASSFEKFDFRGVCETILEKVKALDERIAKKEPFKLIKSNREEGEKEIRHLVHETYNVAALLEPIMPNTSQKVKYDIENNSFISPLFKKVDL